MIKNWEPLHEPVLYKSVLLYKIAIFQRNYRKMTWSFSYNSFEKDWNLFYPNLCYNETCYKGTALYHYTHNLANCVSLELFSFQFINDRLVMLNSGRGFTDIFEQECLLHADKLNAQSRYKEWLHNMKVNTTNTQYFHG